MTRVVLDLERLQAEGKLTPDEAARLLSMGAKPLIKPGFMANMLMIFGALAIAAGAVALIQTPEAGLALAALALGGGGALWRYEREKWGVLADALIIGGAVGVCGYLAVRMADSPALWPLVTLALGAAALVFRNGFLIALAVAALGACVGTGGGYGFASYTLYVQEPLIDIAAFGGLAGLLYWLLPRAGAYQGLAKIAARTAFFFANFGFWVGSLWGDEVGDHFRPPDAATATQAFSIPDYAFTIGWAAALVGVIGLGLRDQNRFVANTGATFLAIHFFTQLFHILGAHPAALLAGGVCLVAVAVGLARFDRWQKMRAAA